MKFSAAHILRRLPALGLTGALLLTDTTPLAIPAMVITVMVSSAPIAEALPRDRMAGRAGARASRQTGRHVSRARRHGYHALPGGARPYAYGGYRYYRVGPRFYYPYMYGGRTVYIDIDVRGGYPAPPPAAGSIDISF